MPQSRFLGKAFGPGRVLPTLSDIEPDVYKEYFVEAEHNSWEGWSDEELNTIMRFVGDVRLYAAVRGEDP